MATRCQSCLNNIKMMTNPPIHIITAHAKVNLNLAVTGRTKTGYHELLSLVVFTQFGDEMRISPSTHHQVTLSGAFAPHLKAAGGEQLLRKTAALYQEVIGTDCCYHITLDKRIPLGGGLGGGSADAGAFLRFLCDENQLDKRQRQSLREASITLGADVPSCFDSQMHIMSSLGEVPHYSKAPSELPVMVLVNPACHADTKSVFQARADAKTLFSTLDQQTLSHWVETADWGSILAAGNDLSAAAIALYPAIDEMLFEMKHLGHIFNSDFIGASMTGSGASAFALFQNHKAAKAYEAELRRKGLWAVTSFFK